MRQFFLCQKLSIFQLGDFGFERCGNFAVGSFDQASQHRVLLFVQGIDLAFQLGLHMGNLPRLLPERIFKHLNRDGEQLAAWCQGAQNALKSCVDFFGADVFAVGVTFTVIAEEVRIKLASATARPTGGHRLVTAAAGNRPA
ncbi:hypothetical protein [Pseudoprimorskyibacter insulae]|uniref:hypothetical protein n=1 Tax=Pseudoprimorskyibacter insulae TaxID=1695997 RepID=UPI0011B272DE|nr:hypothetical protein [Pseudoprimorskyibacter insulae]